MFDYINSFWWGLGFFFEYTLIWLVFATSCVALLPLKAVHGKDISGYRAKCMQLNSVQSIFSNTNNLEGFQGTNSKSCLLIFLCNSDGIFSHMRSCEEVSAELKITV